MPDLRPERESLDGRRFDVLVIGGGINGVAIARECARGGRRTLLVEQHDFASGTTSRSTRIIHGGLRYLEHAEFALVRESLRERERLLRDYPHLVRPMRFLLALPQGGRRSLLALRAGLRLYGWMGGQQPQRDADALRRLDALLDHGHRWTLFSYDDAQCEFPERLVAEWLVAALAAGCTARNHTQVLEVTRSGGKVRGAWLRDRLSGQEMQVEATQVVNATGPWVDRLCSKSRIPVGGPLVGGVRGSHLVLPGFPGAPAAAVYSEAEDGRPIFVVPWNGQLLVGSTEVSDRGDPGRTQPAPQEVAYLFTAFRRLCPAAPVSWGDIRCAFAGVRPLPYAPGREASAITRRHHLHDHAPDGAAGMFSLIGGKLTNATAVGRECARALGVRALEPPAPLLLALAADGVDSSLAQWARQVAPVCGIAEHSARCMAEWHGPRALAVARLARTHEALRLPLCDHSPHVVAEAVEAVHRELAVTLGDILLRRVPVALSGCWSQECSARAATRIGKALGWPERRIALEREEFEAERAAFLRPVSAPESAPSKQVA